MPLQTHSDYLARAETYTLIGSYASVFRLHQIYMAKTTYAVVAQEVDRKIYYAAQEGVPTAFLKWYQGAGGEARRLRYYNTYQTMPPG